MGSRVVMSKTHRINKKAKISPGWKGERSHEGVFREPRSFSTNSRPFYKKVARELLWYGKASNGRRKGIRE